MSDVLAVVRSAFDSVTNRLATITAALSILAGIALIVVGDRLEAGIARNPNPEIALRDASTSLHMQIVGVAFIAVPILSMGLSFALRFRRAMAFDDDPLLRRDPW